MTTFTVRRRAPQHETADRLCTVCWQTPGRPCRRVLSPPGARRLKLGVTLARVHDERRAEA